MTQPIPTPPAPGDPAPAPTNPPTTPPAPAQPPADPPKPVDEPLGPAGLKALQEERKAREALEKQVAALAPLAKLLGGSAPTGDGKTDLERVTERMAQYEADLAAERAARIRVEVAAEKGLTAAQAARLQGSSREELAADADALLALFPAQAPPGPRTPAPDPSQGARGGTAPDVEAQIAEAQKAGDWQKVISLQNSKLIAMGNNQTTK
ncbi:MAG TPA: hypothetical protein VIS06_17480 [Mycobacteriales bacterium]|jgi:3-oxoacyl-[acyl-carrier protein] reductase